MYLGLRLAALFAALLGATAAAALDLEAALKDRVLGDPAAPVTVIEYASFTCPFCAQFHTVNLPDFKARYLDTGKAKLVFRDFPPDGLALKAAALARCLPEPSYFDFVAAAFRSQAEWVARARVQALGTIIELAARHGVGRRELEACAGDEALLDGILRMRQEGEQRYGIDSTPSFVVNGRTYAGDMNVGEFAKIIDPLLAAR